MKWSVRGACAALAACLLLACALSAAAVGLQCFALGSELRGEPFRLGAAAGAFYSGLLLAAGLSLLGAARATPAKCRQLKDYQRGLVLSTVFNALECLLGLLSLLLAKACRAARARRGRRGGRAPARRRGGSGLRAQPPAPWVRRGRRGRRLQQHRPSEASILAPEDSDAAAPGDCAGFAARHAVSYIHLGVIRASDEAGVEVCCGGHPSVELPGYAPSDPDLDASYPYCCRPPREAARPWEPSRAC